MSLETATVVMIQLMLHSASHDQTGGSLVVHRTRISTTLLETTNLIFLEISEVQ